MRTRQKQRGGFTLAELLIVMGIIAVIVAIAVPRFEDIGRGGKMRAALNELRSNLALARQWAIANREEVFVVLPDDFSAVYSGLPTNEYAKALRSYAFYTRNRGYIKDWTYLPFGIYFVDNYNSALASNRTGSCINPNRNVFRANTVYSGPQAIPFPQSSSSTKNLNALRFSPQGWALDNAGGTITDFDFYLAEGVALEGLAGRVVNIVWKDNPVVWRVAVNPITGVLRTYDCSQL